MTLVKFNPEKKNNVLLPGFNDIFESVMGDTFFSDRQISSVPAANISESPDEYCIEIAAPGLKKEDFKVAVEGDSLRISAEKSSEQVQADKVYSRKEFSYQSFLRLFKLPESTDVERIEASYNDGMLTLHLPKKAEAKATTKQISIL